MNVEYINPFIEASSNIISQTTGLQVSLGKIFLKTVPYKSSSVVVLIGLTGRIKGSVVISFQNTLACRIASAMMGGYPLQDLNDLAKSAIAELGNMILGNTATIFYRKGINIDITPPTILTGDNMQFTPSKSVTVCVPLIFDGGEAMELDISYKENC